MKILIFTISVLLSFPTISAPKTGNPKPSIEMIALNSPIKESDLKISITGPAGFEITSAKYMIKDAISLLDKSKKDTPIDLTKSGSSYLAAIDVNMLPPGQYRLYLKVKDKKSNTDVDVKSQKKSVFKDFVNFVIDSSLEVKDPGEEGKKTLAGIDSDNDGIRDDLQRYINVSTQGDVQMAYKQFARKAQLRILNHENRELSNFFNHRIENAIACMYAVGDEATFVSKLEPLMANTELRVKARLNNMKNFHGQSRSEEMKSTSFPNYLKFCEF